jgi:hypothetical protein
MLITILCFWDNIRINPSARFIVSALTHNMNQITYNLPDQKQIKSKLLKMAPGREKRYQIIHKIFRVSHI